MDKPALVALLHDAVRGGGVDGLLRDSQLGTERLQADGGVGDLAQALATVAS